MYAAKYDFDNVISVILLIRIPEAIFGSPPTLNTAGRTGPIYVLNNFAEMIHIPHKLTTQKKAK